MKFIRCGLVFASAAFLLLAIVDGARAEAVKDGTYKAIDYNGKALWTAIIKIKGGKFDEGSILWTCDTDICKTQVGSAECSLPFFSKDLPLTKTELDCEDVRTLKGNVFGAMTSNGGGKNAGAMNLKFLTGKELELFENERRKPEHLVSMHVEGKLTKISKLSSREYVQLVAEKIAVEKAEKKRLAAEKAERERLAAEKAERERLAAEKAERKRLAAEKAERKRLAAEKAERERLAKEKAAKAKKAHLAKLKAEAEKKKKAATNPIKTADQARQFTSDLQSFVKKNPDKVDPMKLAEFFTPAQQEIEAGSFAEKGSNFKKLTAAMSENKPFTAYRSAAVIARAAKTASQKKLAIKKINDGVKTIKSTIAKNPLAPNAFGLMKLVKKYEKVTNKEPLDTLESSVTTLGSSMTKLGVKPPFAYRVTKTPAETAQKKAAAKEAAVKASTSAKSIKLCLSGTKHSHLPIAGKCSASYEKGDYASALREWKSFAEQGNSDAQFNLGQLYRRGQGVPQNFETAVKWYRLAAEQGHPFAQNSMGTRFKKGQGVPQNHKTAVKWYKLAAEQGNTYGQSNLGRMYSKGLGVPQDYKTAVKWYKLAAEQGNAYGQSNLGWMYSKGLGVPQDYKTAMKWYKLAADQGNAYAQGALDDIARLEAKEAKQQAEEAKRAAHKKAAAEKAAEAAKPENKLREYYYTFMLVESCHEVRAKHLTKYFDSNEFDAAANKMAKIENYYKSLNTKMNTDAIWDEAGQLFDEKEASHFERFKMQDNFNAKLKDLCRQWLFSLTNLRLPGEKKKKRRKSFGGSTQVSGAATGQDGLPASAAKYSKPGTADDVDIRLRGRKVVGPCYCLKMRIQNNRLDTVDLNIFGGQVIKDVDGAAAQFSTMPCGVDRNPQLDPNLKLAKGEVASGWSCWKLPSQNYKPIFLELKNLTRLRYGKISLAEDKFGASLSGK